VLFLEENAIIGVLKETASCQEPLFLPRDNNDRMLAYDCPAVRIVRLLQERPDSYQADKSKTAILVIGLIDHLLAYCCPAV